MTYLALFAGILIIGLALWSHFNKADTAAVAELMAVLNALRTEVANLKAKIK